VGAAVRGVYQDFAQRDHRRHGQNHRAVDLGPFGAQSAGRLRAVGRGLCRARQVRRPAPRAQGSVEVLRPAATDPQGPAGLPRLSPSQGAGQGRAHRPPVAPASRRQTLRRRRPHCWISGVGSGDGLRLAGHPWGRTTISLARPSDVTGSEDPRAGQGVG
jgi:hypothetical protein